jgi:hypothetical protein
MWKDTSKIEAMTLDFWLLSLEVIAEGGPTEAVR